MSPLKADLPQSFLSKKKRILQSLAVPTERYDDLSPKGSVDEGIKDLIDEINQLDGYVTTSSCAGRISVFLEGKKSVDSGLSSEFRETAGDVFQDDAAMETKAGVGGKGGGGRWLFVSHDRLSLEGHDHDFTETFAMKRNPTEQKEQAYGITSRFIHFKFEPMVSLQQHIALRQANIIYRSSIF
jgi:tRNA wybutosine-synthesizing protein 3